MLFIIVIIMELMIILISVLGLNISTDNGDIGGT